jgi:hypothetical protein
VIRQILLDLDGVLADWCSPVIRLFDRDPAEVIGTWPAGVYDLGEVLGISEVEMWRRVHAKGAGFWAELEPYPWAHDLLATCRMHARTTILTSPSRDPESLAGKVRWLDRHFGDGGSFRDFLIGPDKAAAAHRGALLIDDRDSMCETFRQHGGRAIVFPQPWSSTWHPRMVEDRERLGSVLVELLNATAVAS